MLDRRTKNVRIFRDTEYRYRSESLLSEAIEASVAKQLFIAEDEKIEILREGNERDSEIIVSGKRTLEAAEPYAKKGKKVGILNFASATNPGGGVEYGASAQEEAICRCSTLFPCLDTDVMWKTFYIPHQQANNPLYNDDCIYTPGVKVFKSDIQFPKMLREKDWWDVNVITCAAPNLRGIPSNMIVSNAWTKATRIALDGLEVLLESRIDKIFRIAIAQGIEVLILGAFGCGAFRNPPEVVAKVFAKKTEEYRKYFETIEYAVFHVERERRNYEEFVKAFSLFGTVH